MASGGSGKGESASNQESNSESNVDPKTGSIFRRVGAAFQRVNHGDSGAGASSNNTDHTGTTDSGGRNNEDNIFLLRRVHGVISGVVERGVLTPTDTSMDYPTDISRIPGFLGNTGSSDLSGTSRGRVRPQETRPIEVNANIEGPSTRTNVRGSDNESRRQRAMDVKNRDFGVPKGQRAKRRRKFTKKPKPVRRNSLKGHIGKRIKWKKDPQKFDMSDFYNNIYDDSWKGILWAIWNWQIPDPADSLFWYLLLTFLKYAKPPGFRDAFRKDAHISARLYWLILGTAFVCLGSVWVEKETNKLEETPTTYNLNNKAVGPGRTPWWSETACNTCNFKDKALKLAIKIHTNTIIFGTFTYNGREWTLKDAEMLLYAINQRCTSKSSVSAYLGTGSFSYIEQMQELSDEKFIDDPEDESVKKVMEFIKEGQLKCEEWIVKCFRNGYEVSCKSEFVQTETKMGTCCTANKMPDEVKYRTLNTIKTMLNKQNVSAEVLNNWRKYGSLDDFDFDTGMHRNVSGGYNSSIPLFQKAAGFQYGFTYILAFDPEEVSCRQQDGDGARIVQHLPTDEPDVLERGTAVAPNSEVFIAVIPDISMADPTVLAFEAKKRGCIVAMEKNLTYFSHYTQSNCLAECLDDIILEQCSCTEFSSPGQPGHNLCKPSDQMCIRNATATFSGQQDRYCPDCLPNCNDVSHRAQASHLPISTTNPPAVIGDLQEKYPGKNFTIVHSAYIFNSVDGHIRTERSTLVEWIAMVGGTIGLTNGVSFVDVGRFIHGLIFLILCIIMWYLERRRERQEYLRVLAEVEAAVAAGNAQISEDDDSSESEDSDEDDDNDAGNHVAIEIISDTPEIQPEESREQSAVLLTSEVFKCMGELEAKLRERNRGLRRKSQVSSISRLTGSVTSSAGSEEPKRRLFAQMIDRLGRWRMNLTERKRVSPSGSVTTPTEQMSSNVPRYKTRTHIHFPRTLLESQSNDNHTSHI